MVDKLDNLFYVAKANGLILALGNLFESSDEIPELYQDAYRSSQLLEENSSKIFSEYIDKCTSSNLDLLTIKTFLPIPYVDSNVDIVAINSKEIVQYRSIMQLLGYKRYQNLADLREPDKEMYYKGSESPKLHLHRAISWNGVIYLDIGKVWKRHKTFNVNGVTVPVPSPEDELLIMAAHVMFENKYISLYEMLYLEWLSACNLDWSYIWKAAKTYFWVDALQTFLSFAGNLGVALGLDLKLDTNLMFHRPASVTELSFPFLLPIVDTQKTSMSKLYSDIVHGRFQNVLRELFTYLLVDPIWMYRKALRKTKTEKL